MLTNKSICVDTVQGIGDLIWSYRKLAAVYDQIEFNVLITHEDSVQRRAEEFLHLLKKVAKVNFKLVSQERYASVAKGFYTIDSIEHEYAINAWLETGIHISAIDEHPVCWNLGINPEPFSFQEDYLLVYVSGCSHGIGFYQMDTSSWSRLVIKACRSLGVKHCCLIGAEYDAKKLWEVYASIRSNISKKMIIGRSINEAVGCIAKAKYFISYQSGLCMLAEELGVPTYMIYYPENSNLTASWIRREHLQKNLIKSSFFGMPLKTMVTTLRQHIAETIGRA